MELKFQGKLESVKLRGDATVIRCIQYIPKGNNPVLEVRLQDASPLKLPKSIKDLGYKEGELAGLGFEGCSFKDDTLTMVLGNIPVKCYSAKSCEFDRVPMDLDESKNKMKELIKSLREYENKYYDLLWGKDLLIGDLDDLKKEIESNDSETIPKEKVELLDRVKELVKGRVAVNSNN